LANGITQMASGLSCEQGSDLNICVLKTSKAKNSISAIKLACCHCGNKTLIKLPEQSNHQSSQHSQSKQLEHDSSSMAETTICFKDDDVLQEPMIPGVKQTALSLSCHHDKLDVCLLRIFSQNKQGKSILAGMKLACCDCGNSTAAIQAGSLTVQPTEKAATEETIRMATKQVKYWCFEDKDEEVTSQLAMEVKQLATGLYCEQDEDKNGLSVCVLKTPNLKTGISGVKIACCDCGNRTMLEIPEEAAEPEPDEKSVSEELPNLGYFDDSSEDQRVIGSFFEDLNLDTFHATPGAMEYCENDGTAVAFKIQYQEVASRKEDNTAMNSICLLCSGNDTICSKEGTSGEWHYAEPKRCHKGFNKVKMRVQEYQGATKDNTGVNDAKFWCRDTGDWARTEPLFKGLGQGSDVFDCGSDQRGDPLCVCGLQTLVQDKPEESTDSDFEHEDRVALVGARFACCKCGENAPEPEVEVLEHNIITAGEEFLTQIVDSGESAELPRFRILGGSTKI